MRAPLVALVLLLVLPSALAQVPGNPVCAAANFAVKVVAPDSVARGGKADVQVSVKNNGQVPANVNISANVATLGWSIVGATSQAQDLQAGSDAKFTFSLTADATAKTSADVNIAGAATCGNSQLPLSCPSGSCTVQLPPSTATVALQAPTGFRIPGLENLKFPIEYLFAGIILVGLAIAVPVAIRQRKPTRGGALVTCPEPLKQVRAGSGASFPLELRNPGDVATKLTLEVGSVPDGWSAFLPLPEIQLAPKETRGLWLMVRSPIDAQSGEAVDVEVSATDPARPDDPSTVRLRAEVLPSGADASE